MLIEILKHFNLKKLAAIVALGVATVSISASAILIRFSEIELSPYAITFHRFWIAALVLGIWSGINHLHRQFLSRSEVLQPFALTESERLDSHSSTSINHWQTFWQLFAAGILIATDLALWAWSLTQTTVANSTLLANLTPLFTCLGGGWFWGNAWIVNLLLELRSPLAGRW